jgi:two-component system sensor kinase FixL
MVAGFRLRHCPAVWMERSLTSADLRGSQGSSARPSTVKSLILGGAVVFSIAVFLLDTLVMFDIAIAVLYIAVVLVSIGVYGRRRVLAACAACMILTVLSLVIQHYPAFSAEAIGRCIVSVIAIAITGALGVRIESTTAELQSQARLLDLTHDAIFMRTLKNSQ